MERLISILSALGIIATILIFSLSFLMDASNNTSETNIEIEIPEIEIPDLFSSKEDEGNDEGWDELTEEEQIFIQAAMQQSVNIDQPVLCPGCRRVFVLTQAEFVRHSDSVSIKCPYPDCGFHIDTIIFH